SLIWPSNEVRAPDILPRQSPAHSFHCGEEVLGSWNLLWATVSGRRKHPDKQRLAEAAGEDSSVRGWILLMPGHRGFVGASFQLAQNRQVENLPPRDAMIQRPQQLWPRPSEGFPSSIVDPCQEFENC